MTWTYWLCLSFLGQDLWKTQRSSGTLDSLCTVALAGLFGFPLPTDLIMPDIWGCGFLKSWKSTRSRKCGSSLFCANTQESQHFLKTCWFSWLCLPSEVGKWQMNLTQSYSFIRNLIPASGQCLGTRYLSELAAKSSIYGCTQIRVIASGFWD